jgi:flavin-dependent dehydrogenase
MSEPRWSSALTAPIRWSPMPEGLSATTGGRQAAPRIYAYFSDFPAEQVELAFKRRHFTGVFPTNDGQRCVFARRGDEEFAQFKAEHNKTHAALVGVANPRLGDWIDSAKRQSRVFGFRATPGFFRKPYGLGWALVGDAGYYKDPVTGPGITDAIRGAELWADAVHAGLDGSQPIDEALAGDQARRYALSRDVYETTQEIAGLGWTEDELLVIFMRFGAAAMYQADAIAAFG